MSVLLNGLNGLMSLSAADLGTEEVKMEKRLVKWLDGAAMWGAIVLIDEAEVYLEQRQSGDLTRNALVTGEHPNIANDIYESNPFDKHFFAPWSIFLVYSFW